MVTFDELDRLLGAKDKADAPCPVCGPRCTTKPNQKKRVLRLWRKDGGAIGFHCPRCPGKGVAFDGDAPRQPRPRDQVAEAQKRRQAEAEDRDRTEYAVGLFRAALPLRGTPGELYLNSRAISLEALGNLNHVMRFAPMLPIDGKRACGIVSLFRDIRTDEERAVHRIFLKPDGSPVVDADGAKVKRMLGPVAGCAIKLDPDEDVTSGLHIGEGVESCLSAMQRGYRPTWALGSAGAIESFPVVSGLDALTVLGERDKDGSLNRANIRAADAVTARYVAAGRDAFFLDPPFGDFNDVLKKVSTQ
jgi:hypothetical protein